MRSRQLASFVTVCEIGSISRAAEKLHTAQPALGLQIRALEDEMGVQLLARHSRGIQPTAAGEIVLAWAKDTLADIQRLKAQVRALSAEVAGSVTLGLTPSLATAFAVSILGALQRDLPNLRVQLIEGVSHVLEEWTASGQVDLALVFDGASSTPDKASLLTERLYYISAYNPARKSGRTIEFGEIAEFPLAIQAPNDSIRMTVEAAAQKAGHALSFDYQIQSFGVMVNLIRSGMANAILPLPVVSELLTDKVLSARRIVSPELTRHLIWKQNPDYAQGSTIDEIKRCIEQGIRETSETSLLAEAYTFHPNE